MGKLEFEVGRQSPLSLDGPDAPRPTDQSHTSTQPTTTLARTQQAYGEDRRKLPFKPFPIPADVSHTERYWMNKRSVFAALFVGGWDGAWFGVALGWGACLDRSSTAASM